MEHENSVFAGVESSSALFKAFVSPFAATAGQVGNSYAAAMLAPPAPPQPEPDPPTLYLPPPGPIYLDTSWRDTGHILLTWLSVTALALGAGVVLGLGVSTCAGKRETTESSSPNESDEEFSHDTLSLGSDDPEKQLKQTIIRNI